MHITELYAALAALLVLVLSMRISLLRNRHRVSVGDGSVNELHCAIRAQGNALEYLPLSLLMLLLLELNGGRPEALHVLGAVLIAGRVLHAWGVSRSSKPTRSRLVGIVLTWLVMLVLVILLLLQCLVSTGLLGPI